MISRQQHGGFTSIWEGYLGHSANDIPGSDGSSEQQWYTSPQMGSGRYYSKSRITVHFRLNWWSRVTGAQIRCSVNFCHRSQLPPPPCDTSFCPPNFCHACGATVAPTVGGFVSQVTCTPAATAGTYVYCHGHTRHRTGRKCTVFS